jgi:predicted amidohydrolase
MTIVRVTICQLPIGQEGLTLRQKLEAIKRAPDFVCLPEYFLIPRGSEDYSRYALRYDRNVQYLARLSKDLNTTLIGGSIVMKNSGGMYNTSFVFRKGFRIGSYRKVFPTVGEMEKGISSGSTFSSWKIEGVRIGVLVCADVLHPECFEEMERQKADIIFVPTTSPFRPDDSSEEKTKRDECIFVKGADSAKSFIVKTCATGSIFGKRLQGRSLIASPWGILWSVFPESESKSIIHSYDLNIDDLAELRRREMIRRLVAKL